MNQAPPPYDPVIEHARTGGSTTRNGQSLSGSRAWVTGVMPEAAEISDRPFSSEEHAGFSANHADILSRHSNAAVGTYFDPHTGLHHLEIVAVSPSKGAAEVSAKHMGERAIYHLATAQTLPVDSTQQDIIPSTFDERFEAIRAGNPQRAPYRGAHFSDAKLDKIEGSRRGTSGLGAEAMRVRLGSQLGRGQDAPGGFHVYDEGSLPDAAMAQRKSAHPVSGHFAFASTDHPIFQAAYAKAKAEHSDLPPEQSHGLALNAAEHALSDEGYDGYYNPRNPQSRFIFGDHNVG